MKKLMLAAAMAASIAAPAMANDLKTSGDDLAILSTQTQGFGGLGMAGGIGLTTVVVTTIIVAGGGGSSTSTTGTN